MSIYIYSTNYISEKLVPPSLRGTKHLAWLKVILSPIQWLWNRIFVDYADGSLYAQYSIISSYVKGDIVVYSDRKVYQCIANAGAGILPSDTNYWIKINDNFIGVRERIRYNAQKKTFEYALNKWFFVPPTDPQIYIVNNIVVPDGFIMGETGAYSSYMASDSFYSTTYMGATYTTTTSYDYTIYVPFLVFNAQGSTTANREQAIRNFADIYNLVGMKYNVITY
jgi:hypothetical protein